MLPVIPELATAFSADWVIPTFVDVMKSKALGASIDTGSAGEEFGWVGSKHREWRDLVFEDNQIGARGIKAVDLRFLFDGHFNLLSDERFCWAITAIICLDRFGDIR